MLSQIDAAVLEEIDDRGLNKTTLERWCPHEPTPQQREFLDLGCLEALFGGAAGGGKSDALLMGALAHVDDPTYAALLLRRTYADLALPGAIMDRAHAWLGGTPAHWNGTEKTWTFPSGARLTFGYLDTDKDKYRYQSSEFQYLAFDELTQFPETAYRYLLSRLRRGAQSSIPLAVRCASNPGGIGHKWVHERFVDSRSAGNRVFTPAKLEDNPHIDATEYRKSLAQLDETTRKQLEDGLWIQDNQGLVYKFSAAKDLVDGIPSGSWHHVLGVDFGASQVDATSAFATWAFNPEHKVAYLVECTKQAGLIVSTFAEHIAALNKVYRYDRMVADQGALGKGYIEELRRRHNLPIQEAQKQNKLGYIKLFNGDLQAGNIKVVEGDASDWTDEAQNLLWNDDGTKASDNYANHATDAALYGWREARQWLYREQDAPPKIGSAAFYDKQAKDYEKKLIARIEKKRHGDFPGDIF